MSASSGAAFAIHAATLRGIEAVPVSVEVSASGGIPGLTIVGMPDSAVLEARSRVRCALRACGFTVPRLHLTINLSPGDLRKTGTGFDLPMAVAILACTGQIPIRGLDDCLFVGELALDGSVLGVRGAVAYGVLARQEGLSVVSAKPEEGLSVAGGCRVIRSLAELPRGVGNLPQTTIAVPGSANGASGDSRGDFRDVVDQELAKRAMQIAAVGGHGLLMVGPPGAGKTMLASRMPGILPRLGESEVDENLLIYSVAGVPLGDVARGLRPFRAPHHSVSRAGLIGGGRPVIPGEISLAHNGVLFLDELPEFGQSVLQALRQPMEEGEVRLVRADGVYVFPCAFQLVAAANPCPCGHLGDPGHPCTCPASAIQKYQLRIGGPLMDRIDLRVDVARPQSKKVIAGEEGMDTATMREQVEEALEFRSWRMSRMGEPPAAGSSSASAGIRASGFVDTLDAGDAARASVASARSRSEGLVGDFCRDAQRTFEGSAERLALGGRAISRISRVARSIADLGKHELVSKEDVLEALAFRSRDTL